MSTTRLDLLLHPVRMRLVHALSAGRVLTTGDLCARLPDLPKATVYRQVERLVRGGVFEVEAERRVRGAVERRYRLARHGALIDPDAAKAMSLEDHRRGFTAAMATLLAEFDAYLGRGGAKPASDGVSYRQFSLWLSRAELERLVREVRKHLLALPNTPGRGRRPYLLSTIFFPTARPPGGRASGS